MIDRLDAWDWSIIDQRLALVASREGFGVAYRLL